MDDKTLSVILMAALAFVFIAVGIIVFYILPTSKTKHKPGRPFDWKNRRKYR